MSGSAERWVAGGCQHDCPDTCAWQVKVVGGQAVDLVAAADHPYTRGTLCAKTHDYLERRVYHPERLLTPLERTGPRGSGEFRRVSWERALDIVAERLRSVIDDHGAQAVLPFSHQGSMGVVQERSIDRRFFARLGASYLHRDVCGYVTSAGLERSIGAGVPMLPEDVRDSRLIILWSTNTLVTNPHLWQFIQEARSNGARLVVVDPLRSASAKSADWHIRPLPGTDSALVLGLVHVLIRDDLVDRDFVASATTGFDELAALASDHPPERVARVTGLEAHEIERFATAYAVEQPAVIRLMLGLEKHRNGGQMSQLIGCLPALTGAWRKRGGGLLHLTAQLHLQALDMDAVTRPDLQRPVRSVHWAHLGRALTELDTPAIHALIVYNSNPAATMLNQELLMRGLAREDLFVMVHEQFLTDTARQADVVLPATTMIEHWDLLRSYGHQYLALNKPAIPARGESVSITELFRRLSARMGLDYPELSETDESIVRAALDSGHPWLEGITFERLAEVGWVELALERPWLPHADGRFPTRSGRCELAVAPPMAVEHDRESLVLISSKVLPRVFNSTYGDHETPGMPVLAISATDADARQVTDGAQVEVVNERGRLGARACVTDYVRPGVVAMAHGRWPSRASGRNVNVLTTDDLSDIGGGGAFYDTRVDVRATS